MADVPDLLGDFDADTAVGQNNVAPDETASSAAAAADGSTSDARKRGSVGSDDAGRPKRFVMQGVPSAHGMRFD